MRRTAKTVAGIAVVAAVVGAGWWWNQRGATTTTARVELLPVRRSALEATIDASGALAADTEVELSFPISGRVAAVPVSVGQAVAPGDVLVTLETADLSVQARTAEANLGSARSAITSARAKLNKLAAGPDPVDLEIARINLDKARDQRWGVQSQRDAVCGRVKSGRAQETDCNQAQASVQQAEDSVRIAQLQYDDLAAGSDATTLADARDTLAKAEAQRDVAQASRDQATLKLEQATLTAPITGTITALPATVGAQAGVGQAMATIGDLSRFRVEVALDETAVSGVAVGQIVRATVGAVPDAVLAGEVDAIAPSAVPQSGVVLYPVVLRMARTTATLRAGMTVDVQIVTASEADVLVLPLRAIQSEGGKHFVDVMDDVLAASGTGAKSDGAKSDGTNGNGANDTAADGSGTTRGTISRTTSRTVTTAEVVSHKVEVTLGTQTESQAVIATGLKAGDVVVVRNAAPSASATTSSRDFGAGPMFSGPGR